MPVTFQFFTPATLRHRNILKLFISGILKRHGLSAGNISFTFGTDEFVLDINKRYLKHDFYTDIITFDLSNSKSIIDADIVISIDRVKENAKEFGNSFNNELHRVIFHGILHLCGYQDKSLRDQQVMRGMEHKLLKSYFNVSRGTFNRNS